MTLTSAQLIKHMNPYTCIKYVWRKIMITIIISSYNLLKQQLIITFFLKLLN